MKTITKEEILELLKGRYRGLSVEGVIKALRPKEWQELNNIRQRLNGWARKEEIKKRLVFKQEPRFYA